MTHMFDSGYSYREVPWHNLGTVADAPPQDWAEFRTLAGLDWEPAFADLFGFAGMDAEGVVQYAEEEGIKKIIRSDTGARLGVATETYPLITHHDMGEVANALMQDDKVLLTTGGALFGGQKVWALFQLGDPIQIKGDPSELLPYVALFNSHDGHGSLRAIATTIRVVCWNTWSAADQEAGRLRTVATIKHSTNWRDYIEDARASLTGARKDSADLVEWFDFLSTVPVTSTDMRDLAKDLFMPKDEAVSDRTRKNIETSTELLMAAYESPTCEGIRGTAYGAVQAVGEYYDHIRGGMTINLSRAQRLDKHTNRTLLSTERYKLNAARILGQMIGTPLVKAAAKSGK